MATSVHYFQTGAHRLVLARLVIAPPITLAVGQQPWDGELPAGKTLNTTPQSESHCDTASSLTPRSGVNEITSPRFSSATMLFAALRPTPVARRIALMRRVAEYSWVRFDISIMVSSVWNLYVEAMNMPDICPGRTFSTDDSDFSYAVLLSKLPSGAK
jgi:hypothetical protein